MYAIPPPQSSFFLILCFADELDFKAEKQDGLYSAKFWLLVDLEKKLPYALRVALKANQSSVTAERLLPDFSADFGAK